MSRRITQKDIAAALCVHVSTVSKALKGDPAVSEVTRQRVRETAKRLGFVPDPVLGALASYRKQLKPEAYHATIAWVYNHPRSETMGLFSGYGNYLVGAKERAEQLGYRIESFWVGEDARDLERLERILQARGIRGLIVAPQFDLERTLALDWNRYASIGIGYSLNEEGIDRVTNDHFATMTSLLERLVAQGYGKIGCYMWETDNLRMGRRARSAILAFSRNMGGHVEAYDAFDAQQFIRWIENNRFDVVVGRGLEQLEAMQQAGLKVPTEIGFAGYALSERETLISGMQHNNRRIGAAAVEWVSGKLQRSQFGRSEFPQRLLITSQWLENGTLQVSRGSAWAAVVSG